MLHSLVIAESDRPPQQPPPQPQRVGNHRRASQDRAAPPRLHRHRRSTPPKISGSGRICLSADVPPAPTLNTNLAKLGAPFALPPLRSVRLSPRPISLNRGKFSEIRPSLSLGRLAARSSGSGSATAPHPALSHSCSVGGEMGLWRRLLLLPAWLLLLLLV